MNLRQEPHSGKVDTRPKYRVSYNATGWARLGRPSQSFSGYVDYRASSISLSDTENIGNEIKDYVEKAENISIKKLIVLGWSKYDEQGAKPKTLRGRKTRAKV